MTNALLNVSVLLVLGVVVAPVLRRLRPGPLLAGALLLVALTVVFDTLMIAADLYVFDPDRILGVYVWGAPVEDFAYALAASALMPALWTWLGRRSRRADDDADPAADAAVLGGADPGGTDPAGPAPGGEVA
jgi:lycopene cyclase domain-containing protein